MGATQLLDMLKDWLAATNPGLVSKDDLARIESRLDELAELLDEIESKLETT